MEQVEIEQVEMVFFSERALFTDPVSRLGGEKTTYPIPPYSTLCGMLESVYWKPTFYWVVDEVRVMNKIQTASESKSAIVENGKTRHLFTYLKDVEYRVRAHIEWSLNDTYKDDRSFEKHYKVFKKRARVGGTLPIGFGLQDYIGTVELCYFTSGTGYYDNVPEKKFGLMFYGYCYPNQVGKLDEFGNVDVNGKYRIFKTFRWMVMRNGIVKYIKPIDCDMKKFEREIQTEK